MGEKEDSFITEEIKSYFENLSSSEKAWVMLLLCFVFAGKDKFNKNQDELADKSGCNNGAEN